MRLLLAALHQRLLHQLLKLPQHRQSPAEAALHRQRLLALVAAGIRQSEAGETMAEARQHLRRWLQR